MKGTTSEGYSVEVRNLTLDLDGVVPRELLRHQKSTEDYLHAIKAGMPDHYRGNHRWRNKYNVETMLDWRCIERKMTAVTMKLAQRHREFWDPMNELLKVSMDHKGQKVWVCHPNVERTSIMEYDGGLRFVDPERLIDPHIGNPDLKALIVKGDQAREAFDRYFRYERLRRRHGTFVSAFYEAVTVRLRELLNEMRSRNTHSYAPTLTFVVQNEGRSYVFKHNNYEISFDDFTSVYVAS